MQIYDPPYRITPNTSPGSLVLSLYQINDLYTTLHFRKIPGDYSPWDSYRLTVLTIFSFSRNAICSPSLFIRQILLFFPDFYSKQETSSQTYPPPERLVSFTNYLFHFVNLPEIYPHVHHPSAYDETGKTEAGNTEGGNLFMHIIYSNIF